MSTDSATSKQDVWHLLEWCRTRLFPCIEYDHEADVPRLQAVLSYAQVSARLAWFVRLSRCRRNVPAGMPTSLLTRMWGKSWLMASSAVANFSSPYSLAGTFSCKHVPWWNLKTRKKSFCNKLCANLQVDCGVGIVPTVSGKTPNMDALPHTETGRFTPQVQLELKIYAALLSCNIAQTSTYHSNGHDKALLPAYDFIGSRNTRVHKSLKCCVTNFVKSL